MNGSAAQAAVNSMRAFPASSGGAGDASERDVESNFYNYGDLHFPNVKDVRNMTQRDWEAALKKAVPDSRRLGRNGFKLGM
jgi:hypothetical protein